MISFSCSPTLKKSLFSDLNGFLLFLTLLEKAVTKTLYTEVYSSEGAILAMDFHWRRCFVEPHPDFSSMIERCRRQDLATFPPGMFCLYHWTIVAPQENVIS